MFTFNKNYFILTLILLLIEIAIAVYIHDKFIRPYIGDLLVVILIYCFLKSFLNSSVWVTGMGVLLFAYLIEALQYFHLVNRLGWQHSKFVSTIIGTSFEWIDLLAYTVGIILVLGIEKARMDRVIS